MNTQNRREKMQGEILAKSLYCDGFCTPRIGERKCEEYWLKVLMMNTRERENARRNIR